MMNTAKASIPERVAKGAIGATFGKVAALNPQIRMKAALAKSKVMDRADNIKRAIKKVRGKYRP